MPVSVHVPASLLIAFLLVLARMLGVFVFLPMPFKDAGPNISRVVLALGTTVALYSRWPAVEMTGLTLGGTLASLVPDAALGLAIGLAVSFLSEAFTVGAQSLALQAGWGYASVVDPTTQADSEVLSVLAQLLAGLLFFAAGIHRFLIKIFADSLSAFPPGSFAVSRSLAREIVHIGSGIFSFGLRLALPVIGLLLMTEITLALLARLNGALQMGQHAFPVKMLITLLVLASVLVVTPHLYSSYAQMVLESIRRNFAR